MDKSFIAALASIVVAGIGVVALIGFMVFLFAFFHQWAWNHFMTPVFGLRNITWTEAFALTMLASMFQTKSATVKK